MDAETSPSTAVAPNVAARPRVLVTVGMGPWPFDRLLRAIAPLCAEFDVFAQTGTSTVELPCPGAAFIGFEELAERVASADVVITHAGNTVRLAQRAGKIPIAIAREAGRGEMRNDHQVEYLVTETPLGRVVALDGDLTGLAEAVREHASREPRMLRAAPPLPEPDPLAAGALLEHVLRTATRTPAAPATGTPGTPASSRTGMDLATTGQTGTEFDGGRLSDSRRADPNGPAGASSADGPFDDEPLRRFSWAWSQLSDRTGRHLDLGIGDGAFTAALARRGGLDVVAADAHPGYLRAFGQTYPDVPAVRVRDGLPFAAATFDSVSMLDSLEHTPDDTATLREVARVLRPGGRLVLTVPARHAFSLLDPDDVKLRAPRLHGAVYRARFGAARHHARFVDDTDGLRGDLAWNRTRHTNYRPDALLDLMARCGLQPVIRDGANLFWRLLQIPELLGPPAIGRLLAPLARWDARRFHRANLFVVATRTHAGGDAPGDPRGRGGHG